MRKPIVCAVVLTIVCLMTSTVLAVEQTGTVHLSREQRTILEKAIEKERLARATEYDTVVIDFQITEPTYKEISSIDTVAIDFQITKPTYKEISSILSNSDSAKTWIGEVTFTVSGFQRTNAGWQKFITIKDVVTVKAVFPLNTKRTVITFTGPNYPNWFSQMNCNKYM